jgi:DNA-binding MarR family transcriptional regulator
VPALTPARAAPARAAPPAAGDAALPRWRSGGLDIYAMPGHAIRRLQQVAVALFSRHVDHVDITPVQFAALVALRQRKGLDQVTLSALIGYDRATIGGVIDRLEAKRWVVREAGRTDRRTKLVSLTPAGASALRRVGREVQAVQEALLAPLGAAERHTFARLCRKLLDAHLGNAP